MNLVAACKNSGDILGRRADKEAAELRTLAEQEAETRRALKTARDSERTVRAEIEKLTAQSAETRSEKAKTFFAARLSEAESRLGKVAEAVGKLENAVKVGQAKKDAKNASFRRVQADSKGMYDEADRLSGGQV